jgi:hypothetical protein
MSRISVLFVALCLVAVPAAAYVEDVSDPAPASWEIGSEWTFVAKSAGGEEQTFVFRVTDRPIGNSDRCFELETVSDPRPPIQVFELASEPGGEPVPTSDTRQFSVYACVDGPELNINLLGRMKDASDNLVGRIDGDRFAGVRRGGNGLVGEPYEVPGVVGWRNR